MKNEKMTPRIRFKGFTDAWEQRKLKDITTYKNGKGHEGEQSTSGNFELINLNSISIDGGLKKSGKFIGGNPKTLKVNDLVMVLSDIAHGDLLGKVALIPLPNKYVLNQRVALLRPKDYKTSVFLFYRINNLQRHFKSRGNGTSQLNISKSDVENTIINIPNDVEEQKRIGKLLDKIDKLITSNARNENKLLKLKKLVSNLVFDARIKIININTTWNERKLGEISKIYRGSSPRPIQDKKWFSKNNYVGWLRISDVTEQNGIITHTSQHLSNLGMKKTRVLENEHLILSIAASVGKPVINKVPIGIHDGFIVFENTQFNIYFMFYLLNNYKYIWNKYGQPGAQINLNSDIIRNQSFNLPDINTQNKISNILTKIENLIEVSKLKNENLKQLKRYLMQNMFI